MEPSIPLNGLQQMMLRWEELHPYNAVHIVILSADCLTAERVHYASRQVSREFDMHRPQFDSSKKISRWQHSEWPIPVSCQVEESLTRDRIEKVVTNELNKPFKAENDWPFRILLLESEDQSALMLTYRHAVSDAFGISMMMRRLVSHCAGIHTGFSWRLDGDGRLLTDGDKSSNRTRCPLRFSTIGQLHWHRKCWAPRVASDAPWKFEFLIHSEQMPTSILKRSARKFNISVQELLFAATLEACVHVVVPPQEEQHELAVSASVDVRRLNEGVLDDAFGLFLGSFAVKCRSQECASFEELASSVRQQCRSVRDEGHFLHPIFRMESMARIWDMLPRRVNSVLGQRLIPFVAGTSNVNLTDSNTSIGQLDNVTDYMRGTGLGVMLPMMVTLTTHGNFFNLTSTHRTASFRRDQVRAVMTRVAERLTQG